MNDRTTRDDTPTPRPEPTKGEEPIKRPHRETAADVVEPIEPSTLDRDRDRDRPEDLPI